MMRELQKRFYSTGLAAMWLTVHFFIICVFSISYARKHAFRAFWIVHLSYPIFLIMTVLHGSGRLVQAPFFYYFLLGPAILFTVDHLITVSRKKIEINVVKAELLPSGRLASMV